jgi:hypothetical protein
MIIRDLSDPCLPLPCASGEKTLEVWGGIEYTRNRVRDCYFDQMEFSGRFDRTGDLDHIAELGIAHSVLAGFGSVMSSIPPGERRLSLRDVPNVELSRAPRISVADITSAA